MMLHYGAGNFFAAVTPNLQTDRPKQVAQFVAPVRILYFVTFAQQKCPLKALFYLAM
jgi:hypothetical protein